MRKRYIKIHKTKTSFYFHREDEKKLKEELKKIPLTRCFKPMWNTDRFTLKVAISIQMKETILNAFKEEQNNNTISGYYGCPITGYNFGWK